MKSFIFTLTFVFALIFTGNAQAQSFDEVFKKYKKEENINGIKINKLGCFLTSLFVDDNDEGAIFLKKSSSIRILINENGRDNNLLTDLQAYIKSSNMDELMTMRNDKEDIRIYIKDKNQVIKQLLIVFGDEKDQFVLHLDGKFPLKMIKEMMTDKSALSIKAKL